ncbi:uncharacterized protein BDZ99DRAFT_59736 [Mytilinidion resinicola]|uniref:Uncharacterized protein n=1 Tax=Mytilinidion resinicola TaxID=574789 RepID=A0A6A6YJ96_9PEZI|nr:uncharacterized protein BDZ99DRAFT_59736 [Mytilinidion resinicola]KAF2808628.1 hypothetical protein BDZ99DRAFT_59736 [Mytilinidion resinicola]
MSWLVVFELTCSACVPISEVWRRYKACSFHAAAFFSPLTAGRSMINRDTSESGMMEVFESSRLLLQQWGCKPTMLVLGNGCCGRVEESYGSEFGLVCRIARSGFKWRGLVERSCRLPL